MSESLTQAINDMRTMREAYDELANAAEAYNAGKTELAANITAKGVEASASESLPELAEKVSAIAQEAYEINGGEMYAKQLFGSLETPNYWNLYDILAQLLSDGRLVSYGGILLAEYYRGYGSLALAGAGAGGAYVVSDLDEQGNFKMYTEDTTHVWATEFDGKGNRWVAYCFADEYHDFQITDTNTSPRSIFIGRKVGTITCLVNVRISKVVVPDGNKLRSINIGSHAANFDQSVVVRNIESQTGTLLYMPSSGYNLPTESLFFECERLSGTLISVWSAGGTMPNLTNMILKIKHGEWGAISGAYTTNLKILVIDGMEDGTLQFASAYSSSYYTNLKELYISNIEGGTFYNQSHDKKIPASCILYISYKGFDKTKGVYFTALDDGQYNGWINVSDVRLQKDWCKPLDVNKFKGLTEANMFEYVLKNLKQDEPNCGSGVTITLGSTNLAKLTSEESQALLAELRGTYGYTFA